MTLNLPEELKHCTGKGVKVAVIDSGIDLNSPMSKNVKAGIGIGWDGEKVFYHDDIQDEHGHGTKICGILLKRAPKAELYIARIFEKRLLNEMDCLVEGIEWAIRQKVNIINASLGTTSTWDIDGLKKACQRAYKKNVIIVSSLDGRNRIAYPGWFRNVLCVYNANHLPLKRRKKLIFGFEGESIKHCANSYLAPLLSSLIACYFEKSGYADPNSIIENLFGHFADGRRYE